MTEELAKKRLEVWLKCLNCPEDKQCYDKHLKTLCGDYEFKGKVSLEDAIKVALSALSVPEREKGTDLISREAVIDLLNQFGYYDKEMERDLSAIPSATPERETLEKIEDEIWNLKEKCTASDYLGCGILDIIERYKKGGE